MRSYAPLLVAVGLLVAAAPPKQKESAEGLDGTWLMVGGEDGGKPLPPDLVKSTRLTIKGDHYTLRTGDDTGGGTLALNAQARPPAIDSTASDGPWKGQTIHGIYRLRGDEFTVCFAPPGKERPTQFTTKSGTGSFLHVWKRQKE
jgi:uncharacterized protein (TIGR03067 family)